MSKLQVINLKAFKHLPDQEKDNPFHDPRRSRNRQYWGAKMNGNTLNEA